jgi:pimeloyl-ACP methyl ester carboxylesterase
MDHRKGKNGMSAKNGSSIISRVTWVLVSLALVSCLGPKEAPITVPPGAQAGDLVGLEPCTYEAGDLEYAADCGTLVVPENRSDPRSRLIALPVLRFRATGSDPAEPIVKLGGGPGKSNMQTGIVPWFVENHDVVLVGYRGVDGTVTLHCPEVSHLLKSLPVDLLDDAALDALNAAYARCGQRLQKSGVDTAGYTVAEVVEDVEAARVGLGYERINLLSDSYGTNVARIYAYLYPESIYRSAMIAVDAPGATVHEPSVVDEQLRYYARLCAQDARCSARTDDLAETVRSVSRDMPRRWLFLPVNAGLVKVATVQFLASTNEAAQTFDVWLAAAEGDPSGMAMLTLLGPRIFATASVWGDNAAKRTSLGDYDLARDYRAELDPPASIIGSPGTIVAVESTGWPTFLIPEEVRRIQPSDVETLLVSGSIDLNTPAQFARDQLLPSLSKGQQVILSEYGHGEYLSAQPEASKQLLNSFYDSGVADDSLFTYHPVDFHVGLGYPTLAKLGLAAVVLVIGGVTAFVWFTVRRAQRRRTKQRSVCQVHVDKA